mgnify:CR=1 FL=1
MKFRDLLHEVNPNDQNCGDAESESGAHRSVLDSVFDGAGETAQYTIPSYDSAMLLLTTTYLAILLVTRLFPLEPPHLLSHLLSLLAERIKSGLMKRDLLSVGGIRSEKG